MTATVDLKKITREDAACSLEAREITLATRSAAGNPRPFEMDAYNGAVFEHALFGQAVFEVSGIRAPLGGVPAFRQHKPELFVGRCETVKLEAGSVRIAGFLFDGVEAADEVARISDQGGKWQASIRAVPRLDRIEFVDEGATASVNGVQLAGPLAVFRESDLIEVSWVPRGADTTTSAVALSGGATPTTTKKEPPMDPVATERARAKSIREAFPKHREFADKQVDAGVSLAEAKAAFADVALAEQAESQKANEAAIAAATARAAEAEKKLAEAEKKLAKPSHASELGAAGGGTTTLPGDEKDPIKRWDAALAAEVKRLKDEGAEHDADALGLRRGIALSTQANLRALAVSNLMDRDPAMHKAYVAAFNASGVGSRTRNNRQ